MSCLGRDRFARPFLVDQIDQRGFVVVLELRRLGYNFRRILAWLRALLRLFLIEILRPLDQPINPHSGFLTDDYLQRAQIIRHIAKPTPGEPEVPRPSSYPWKRKRSPRVEVKPVRRMSVGMPAIA
jgi:hypothetical protein